jgi:hemerythrin-like domain-containing protein
MGNQIEAWRREHEYFARLLQLLQKQVDVFHTGGELKYALMPDIVSYLRDYFDQFHCLHEDVAFEWLARRSLDLEPIVARLQQEHRITAHASAMRTPRGIGRSQETS